MLFSDMLCKTLWFRSAVRSSALRWQICAHTEVAPAPSKWPRQSLVGHDDRESESGAYRTNVVSGVDLDSPVFRFAIGDLEGACFQCELQPAEADPDPVH
mmetsp:Transcript_98266/g.225576  ORF Transcript_98266/g.225576 Transcript_98266/m.225576 type:complete len:100 (+) Transcript_98266:694-993(+)